MICCAFFSIYRAIILRPFRSVYFFLSLLLQGLCFLLFIPLIFYKASWFNSWVFSEYLKLTTQLFICSLLGFIFYNCYSRAEHILLDWGLPIPRAFQLILLGVLILSGFIIERWDIFLLLGGWQVSLIIWNPLNRPIFSRTSLER
jgi:hypothetical protein